MVCPSGHTILFLLANQYNSYILQKRPAPDALRTPSCFALRRCPYPLKCLTQINRLSVPSQITTLKKDQVSPKSLHCTCDYSGSMQSYGGSIQSYRGSMQSYGGSIQSYGGSIQSYGGSVQSYGGSVQSYGGSVHTITRLRIFGVHEVRQVHMLFLTYMKSVNSDASTNSEKEECRVIATRHP